MPRKGRSIVCWPLREKARDLEGDGSVLGAGDGV